MMEKRKKKKESVWKILTQSREKRREERKCNRCRKEKKTKLLLYCLFCSVILKVAFWALGAVLKRQPICRNGFQCINLDSLHPKNLTLPT
jgi:hypothetical protein